MKLLSEILEKVRKKINLKEENRNLIISRIKEITNEEIKEDNIKIINNTIYIKENPYFKREILLKKNKIIKELNSKLFNLIIKDIN